MYCILVDWSGGWATPWGLASQMRPCSEAKRLIGRPQESAQPERKSTTRFGDEPKIADKTINIYCNRHMALDLNWYSIV